MIHISNRDVAHLGLALLACAGLSLLIAASTGVAIAVTFLWQVPFPDVLVHTAPVLESVPNRTQLSQVVTVSPGGRGHSVWPVVSAGPRRNHDDKPLVWKPPPPKRCREGTSYGYERWSEVREAVRLANVYSVESFIRWSSRAYYDDGDRLLEDASLYYEDDLVVTLCPGVNLQVKEPLWINAQNLVIQCGSDGSSCRLSGGQSHMIFGPHAQNVRIRNLVFRKSRSTSLLFPHDGASASFDDCVWEDCHSDRPEQRGSIIHINSTSYVHMYRMEGMHGEPLTLSA